METVAVKQGKDAQHDSLANELNKTDNNKKTKSTSRHALSRHQSGTPPSVIIEIDDNIGINQMIK